MEGDGTVNSVTLAGKLICREALAQKEYRRSAGA
jgi:hypothetical protein